VKPMTTSAWTETIDVSRPRAATGTARVAAALGNLALAILLALLFPVGLMVVLAPLALLAWAILALARLF